MPPLATADDAALLGALPIAAAIIGLIKTASFGSLPTTNAFDDAVELSTGSGDRLG